jgi:hypothetical protein
MTPPHEGYHIVKKWREKYFANPKHRPEIQEDFLKVQTETPVKGSMAPTSARFFIYTSNVRC